MRAVALLILCPIVGLAGEPVGSALEGVHALTASAVCGELTSQGFNPMDAAVVTLMGGVAVDLIEWGALDAQEPLSLQDQVANLVGVLAQLTGAEVHASWTAYLDPTDRKDIKPWVRVPLIPVNGRTNAVELEYGGLVLGYKYLGLHGDVVVGRSSMPVMAWERSAIPALIPYVGYCGDTYHAALGIGQDGVPVLGGHRFIDLGPLLLDATILWTGEELGVGVCVALRGDET